MRFETAPTKLNTTHIMTPTHALFEGFLRLLGTFFTTLIGIIDLWFFLTKKGFIVFYLIATGVLSLAIYTSTGNPTMLWAGIKYGLVALAIGGFAVTFRLERYVYAFIDKTQAKLGIDSGLLRDWHRDGYNDPDQRILLPWTIVQLLMGWGPAVLTLLFFSMMFASTEWKVWIIDGKPLPLGTARMAIPFLHTIEGLWNDQSIHYFSVEGITADGTVVVAKVDVTLRRDEDPALWRENAIIEAKAQRAVQESFAAVIKTKNLAEIMKEDMVVEFETLAEGNFKGTGAKRNGQIVIKDMHPLYRDE